MLLNQPGIETETVWSSLPDIERNGIRVGPISYRGIILFTKNELGILMLEHRCVFAHVDYFRRWYRIEEEINFD